MVSVIINNHNYGRYIGEAIDSVLEQSYRDFEIIIVDGASEDNSREVIYEYLKKYPQKISVIMKTTSGQGPAINAGFSICRGEIIAFLDSDDKWFPNKLERIVELHKEYDFVAHSRISSDGKREKISTYMMDFRTELLKQYSFVNTNGMSTSSISFKRDLLKKALPINEEHFFLYTDFYLEVVAVYWGSYIFVNEELAYYRVHGQNASRELIESGLNEFSFSNEAQKNNKNAVIDLNEKLKEQGEKLVPLPSRNLYREALKIVGQGFCIENKAYVLYGTGAKAAKYRKYIEDEGGSIAFYCDSNSEKWGKVINGRIVLSPEELLKNRKQYNKIVIGSTYYYEISKTLDMLGLKRGKDYIYTELFVY